MFGNTSGKPTSKLVFAIGATIRMALAGVPYQEWKQFKRATREAVQSREIVDSVKLLLSGLCLL